MFPLPLWVGRFQTDLNDRVILAEVGREVDGCTPTRARSIREDIQLGVFFVLPG